MSSQLVKTAKVCICVFVREDDRLTPETVM